MRRDHDVATFRFDMTSRRWALYWRDRNLSDQSATL
ncbi:MAG: DUF3024 domain-containing protein [Thermoanaerobaculia bacterium]|nr:DUF3024 domain-containing protein [Thermoanaerobaculia bacterium]MBP9824985.1 DUF3024 domain-containing protein [Thermoanaerobaculia bacterium]